MTLIDADRLDNATETELLDLRRAIWERLTALDETRLLTAARDTLHRLGLNNAKRLIVGVDEWDDGYYWSGVDKVLNAAGTELVLHDEARTILGTALDEPLTHLSVDNGQPGRFDRLEIDLATNTIHT